MTKQAHNNLTNALITWYRKERRILPWREDPTPYHVWLSEIMLQQTRVEAVKGYYQRFLETLPDIEALAVSDEDTYLKLWEGLGYYSRVRNLHKAAQVIRETYGGEMPGSREELLKLPGIGPYTASAIASIAFGEPVAAVDGNFLRVFARMTTYAENIKDPKAKKAAEAYFAERMKELSTVEVDPDAERAENLPGMFNQAVMDLGATICAPNGAPSCSQCPWQHDCLAYQKGTMMEYPVVPAKKERKVEHKTVFLIHCQEEIALHKRPARGLLAGLYEFPNAEGILDDAAAVQYVRDAGFEPVRITPLPGAKHIFTHKEWWLSGYDVLVDEISGRNEASGSEIFLANRTEIDDTYSIPSAFAAYRRYLEEHGFGE